MQILKLVIVYRFLHVYQRVYHNYGDIITINIYIYTYHIYIHTYITYIHTYISNHIYHIYIYIYYNHIYIIYHIYYNHYIHIYIIIYSYVFWDMLPIQTRTCLPKLRAQTRQCASRSTACMTCHQGTERNSREITIWGLRKTMSKPFLWVNTWGRLYSFFPFIQFCAMLPKQMEPPKHGAIGDIVRHHQTLGLHQRKFHMD